MLLADGVLTSKYDDASEPFCPFVLRLTIPYEKNIFRNSKKNLISNDPYYITIISKEPMAKTIEAYILRNNILYRRDGKELKLAIPQSIAPESQQEAHNNPLLGEHIRYSKTLSKDTPVIFFPNMGKKIKKYVRHCDVSEHNNIDHRRSRGFISPLRLTHLVLRYLGARESFQGHIFVRTHFSVITVSMSPNCSTYEH